MTGDGEVIQSPAASAASRAARRAAVAASSGIPLFATQTSFFEVASSNFEDTIGLVESPVTAKAALLQALVRGPGYGLDLIERVRAQTGGKLVLGQGSVYPALRDLEREGLLESYEGEPVPERGGRPRRYYRLNAAGAKAAMEQRDTVLGLFEPIPGVR
jgi:PadR family transcriptional regulator, regulatory protein PadR